MLGKIMKQKIIRSVPYFSSRKCIGIALVLFSLSLFRSVAFSAAQETAAKRELVINSMASDPSAKKSFEVLVDGFRKKNPEINVKVNTIDHESYKVQIRTWLPNQAPDVATWFAGNRARFFIEKGLVEPIDDLWAEFGKDFSDGAKSASSFNGKSYLLPLNYYHWGFYYRKDLFESAGIKQAPKTWDEFVAAVDALNAKKIIPITIGTKQAWPSAAWFDFLNMRINGYDYHIELLAGKHSFTDQKVKNVMEKWKILVDKKAFPKDAPALTWQEAAALLWQGKSAMYLMGNFIATEIPADVKDKISFFSFPTVDASVATAEVAPTDVIFIPSKAKNKSDAKLFLKYAASSEAQSAYNDANGLLPPNTKSLVDLKNPYRKVGMDLLSNAKGLSQFFDRDADPQVAKVGMDGFVEFLEAAQKRVAKAGQGQ
jgi:multiple sugar transport system substrate-binding protein